MNFEKHCVDATKKNLWSRQMVRTIVRHAFIIKSEKRGQSPSSSFEEKIQLLFKFARKKTATHLLRLDWLALIHMLELITLEERNNFLTRHHGDAEAFPFELLPLSKGDEEPLLSFFRPGGSQTSEQQKVFPPEMLSFAFSSLFNRFFPSRDPPCFNYISPTPFRASNKIITLFSAFKHIFSFSEGASADAHYETY